MPEFYKMAAQLACAETVEKKSRFIGVAAPVESLEAAQILIADTHKKHREARHHVYAYRIGLNGEQERQSDDGEPSGTGGAPLMEILKAQELCNTILIVTRYFGGILLGTGGLRRAYGQAAKEALMLAGIAEKRQCSRVTVTCGYDQWGELQYGAEKRGVAPEEVSYTEKITAAFYVESGCVTDFIKSVTEITNGQARIATGESVYR